MESASDTGPTRTERHPPKGTTLRGKATPTTDGVGLVETWHLSVDGPIELESGKTLPELAIAYETYGRLNAEKSNAVLIVHALSGDAHAAGRHSVGDAKPGWWDDYIGPGKAFDTNKLFVICSNNLGGCKGTTGPSSRNPETGRPYALDFPVITIRDMVEVQNRLVDEFGIKRLLAVAGGSMGGMLATQWVLSHPEKVGSAIIVASALSQSAQNIAFHETGRQAIMSDPNWQGGRYYDTGRKPSWGLAVARMIGHITYLSEKSMQAKFGRSMKNGGYAFDFSTEFEVQSYLAHQGSAFVKRFDANSYLYITKAIDYFNVGFGDAVAGFRRSDADILAISFSSDWLYPSEQVKDVVKAARQAGLSVSYCEIGSDYGHDAFLVDAEKQPPMIRTFLEHQLEGRSAALSAERSTRRSTRGPETSGAGGLIETVSSDA